MIILNKLIIYEYINRIKYEDLINYCNNKNITINNKDLDIIYKYIKNDYKRFFNNPEEILNEAKYKLSTNTFNEVIKLYNQYKSIIYSIK